MTWISFMVTFEGKIEVTTPKFAGTVYFKIKTWPSKIQHFSDRWHNPIQSWHIVYMHPLTLLFGYLCHLFWPEGNLQGTIISHLWNRSSQPPWKGDMFGPRGICQMHKAKSWWETVDVHCLVVDYPIASRGFFPNPPPLPKKNNGFPTSTVPPRRRRRLRRLDFNQRRLGAWKSVSLGCRENDMVYI